MTDDLLTFAVLLHQALCLVRSTFDFGRSIGFSPLLSDPVGHECQRLFFIAILFLLEYVPNHVFQLLVPLLRFEVVFVQAVCRHGEALVEMRVFGLLIGEAFGSVYRRNAVRLRASTGRWGWASFLCAVSMLVLPRDCSFLHFL